MPCELVTKDFHELPVQELTGREALAWPFPTTWSVFDEAGPVSPGPMIWRDRDLAISADASNSDIFQVRFADSLTFQLDFRKRAIGVSNSRSASPETVRHLVLDQIYPRILAHEGSLVLHAAGVMIGEEAVLLLGASGSGKSTLAASFHTDGRSLIGDDAVVACKTGGRVTARAVYGSLRLFEDSLQHILPDAKQLSPVADYTNKWNVEGLDGARPLEPVSVSAIFILDARPSAGAEKTPIGRAEACMALVEQSFALDPTNASDARERMTEAAEIVEGVPTFRLSYPRDYRRLGEVKQAIVDSAATG